MPVAPENDASDEHCGRQHPDRAQQDPDDPSNDDLDCAGGAMLLVHGCPHCSGARSWRRPSQRRPSRLLTGPAGTERSAPRARIPLSAAAPVAQLDRASASEAEGYRFEPGRAHHHPKRLARPAERAPLRKQAASNAWRTRRQREQCVGVCRPRRAKEAISASHTLATRRFTSSCSVNSAGPGAGTGAGSRINRRGRVSVGSRSSRVKSCLSASLQ